MGYLNEDAHFCNRIQNHSTPGVDSLTFVTLLLPNLAVRNSASCPAKGRGKAGGRGANVCIRIQTHWNQNPGGKMAAMTSKEFARLLGVSQSTVSRALNGSSLVPEGKRNRIISKAAEIGFELNRQAQSLRTNRTGTVGILFQRHFKGTNENPMLGQFYDTMQRELIKFQYDVMTIYEHNNKGISALERIIKSRKLDGMFSFRTDLSPRERELLAENAFPCVTMLYAGTPRRNLHYCRTDIEAGAGEAGRFFAGFPDYEPVYLGINEEPANTAAHIRGFKAGLAAKGGSLKDKNIHYREVSFNSGYAFGCEMRPRWQRQKTALFAYNDLMARGIVEALREGGVAVPEQVHIIGMDDIPMSTWMRPHLSTLHIPLEEIIPNACRLLRDLIEGQDIGRRQTVYHTGLILRQTTLPGILVR